MNVKELRELLTELPDEMPVIMSKDEEGNHFSPLCELSPGRYQAVSTYSGEWYDPEDQNPNWTPEDEIPEDAIPAICLWPIN